MPDSAFDRWTRRRFGRAAGIALTTPLLAGAVSPAAAKHRHKKKKKKKKSCLNEADGECQPHGADCTPIGSPCCDCLSCELDDFPDEPTNHYICI